MSTKRKRTVDDNLDDEFCDTNNNMISILKDAVDKFYFSTESFVIFSKAELISVMYLKFGFDFVEDLRLVLSVVSEECGPWRKEMVVDLLQRVRNVTLSPKDVEVVEVCINEPDLSSRVSCTNVLPVQLSQLILEKRVMIGDAYGGCISPPTSICYQCGFKLAKNNKPIDVTLFTATGSLPMKKVELRCRHCSLNYGVAKFGNKKDGYQYYSSPRYVVEASDVCYIDRTVMTFFSALRYINERV